jgi:hypothetical protein
MRPPEEHIQAALDVEKNATEEWDLYLECLNGKPMSQRITDQELRDGCVLTFSVFNRCRKDFK